MCGINIVYQYQQGNEKIKKNISQWAKGTFMQICSIINFFNLRFKLNLVQILLLGQVKLVQNFNLVGGIVLEIQYPNFPFKNVLGKGPYMKIFLLRNYSVGTCFMVLKWQFQYKLFQEYKELNWIWPKWLVFTQTKI